MRNLLLVLVLAAFLGFLEPAPRPGPTPSEAPAPHLFSLYSAVLASIESGSRPCVICESVDSSELGSRTPDVLDKDLWLELRRVNHGSDLLDVRLPGRAYIARSELNEFPRSGNFWDNFYRRYPGSGGIITLSKPGLDRAGGHALVYAARQSDWKLGEGRVLKLKRVKAGWVVTKTIGLWRS